MNSQYNAFPKFTSPARYHNGAVDAYKNDGAESALEILEEGLSFYPYDVDLLADAVQWAPVGPGALDSADGEVRYAEDYYKVLAEREFMWTWRAYDFSIDYLVDKKSVISDQEGAMSALSEADELSISYVEAFPNDERSYAARVKVLKALRKYDEAERLLHDVVFGGEEAKAISAPSCCVEYIGMLLEKGDYATAAKVARKAIIGDAQTQPTVNLGYLLFLEALSLDALYLKGGTEDGESPKCEGSEITVDRVYKLYGIARELVSDRSSFVSTIDGRAKMLEGYSGKKCDFLYDDDELKDILAKLNYLSDEEDDDSGEDFSFD